MFGIENVVFRPIVHVSPDHIAEAERVVLRELWRWRVRHTNGRLHEWLVDISPGDVENIMIDALTGAGVEFRHADSQSTTGDLDDWTTRTVEVTVDSR